MDQVDVILPTHRRPHTIAYAIQAVLGQTYPNFVLHVVGDGCDAETEAIARSFTDPRVRFHRFAKAMGFGYANRNLPILLLWSHRTARFLYPLQPFLLFHFLAGLRVMLRLLLRWRRPHGAAARFADATVACMGALLVAMLVAKDLRPGPPSTQFVRDFSAGTSWLKEQTRPDAVVLAAEPAAVHLHARRPVVPQQNESSRADLERLIDKYRVAYVLVAPVREWAADGSRRYNSYTKDVLLPLLEERREEGRMTLVYESEPRELVRIYRVETR
jgi:hypothetical protein